MHACPDPSTLRALLANTLPQARFSEVETHVEGCPSCQHQLESWTARASAPLFATLEKPGPERPPAPLSVAGYETLGEAGRGGHGVVFRARHLGLNRVVALKVLRQGEFATPLERERFLVEARAAAQLTHPNIVPVHDVGSTFDGAPYYAMEWVAGGTLASRLQVAPLAPMMAAELLEVLAQAVQHAHETGIIHRDLKPANVLLPGDALRQAKIADFGLAKLTREPAEATPTVAVFGTPSYMAPEQAFGRSREVGPGADVYSLGVILYECLTGRPPFRAGTPYETLLLVRDHEPVSPRRLVPSLPRDLETICQACLEKDPRRRYPSAGDFAADLARFRAGEPIRARPVGRLERLSSWGRRRPREAALSGVLAGVVVSAFVLLTVLWRIAEVRGQAAREEKERVVKLLDQTRGVVKDYFTRVSESPALQDPSVRTLREDLLLAARTHLEGIVETTQDGMAELELSDSHARLFHLYRSRGELARAREASAKSLAIRERLVEQDPDKANLRDKLAIALENHATAILGESPGQSRELYARCEALREQLLREHPHNLKYRLDLLTSLFNRAIGHYEADAFPEAEKLVKQALALGEAREALDHKEDYLLRLLANCRELLGAVQVKTNRKQESLATVRAALRHWEAVKDARSTLRNRAQCHGQLAEHHDSMDERQEARKCREKAVDLYQELISTITRTDPTIREARQELAKTLRALGRDAEARETEKHLINH